MKPDVRPNVRPDVRIGNGYDVHAFIDHESTDIDTHFITLCGHKVPFYKRLNGHSDSDVALHALTDALLGTYNLGDIGTYFPPSEAKWKNADSSIFVLKALKLLEDKGGEISNIDLTIIAQAPTITPYRKSMTENLAKLLQIDNSRIGLKATTNEKLGFIGRGEGIAAIATVCVIF